MLNAWTRFNFDKNGLAKLSIASQKFTKNLIQNDSIQIKIDTYEQISPTNISSQTNTKQIFADRIEQI